MTAGAPKPPTAVARAAKKGLALRRRFKRGGTMVGVARARDLARRRAIPVATLKRMRSFFARHAVDKRGEQWGRDDDPSAGYVAWLLWGGEPGRAWAEKALAAQERSRSRDSRSREKPARRASTSRSSARRAASTEKARAKTSTSKKTSSRRA
jgi:hypothetical protein